MYPLSFLQIIQAANAGTSQDFFADFNASTHASAAHFRSPNTAIYNYFDDTRFGRTNCTDGAVVFGSTPSDPAQVNLWGCALYPNLTRDFREEKLSVDERNFVIGNGTDTNPSIATQVTAFLSTCLKAWCDNSEACGKTACQSTQTTLDNQTILSAAGVDTCLSSICGIRRSASPDIAGIGVITSIFMQLTITVAAPIILMLCQIIHHRVIKRCKDIEKGLATKPRNPFIPLSSIRKMQESLLATLDDFQRAQCCFAIAIDIASLITLFSNGPEKPTRIDRNAITLASFAGTLPSIVILATLLLYKDRDTTYTVYLTTATWLLSLVTGYLPLIRPLGEIPHTYIGAQPAACGYQPPEYVCKELGGENSVEQFSWIASILSAISMSFLAARWVLPYCFNIYVRSPVRVFIATYIPKPVQHRFGHWIPEPLRPRYVTQALRSFIYIALLTSLVNCFVYVLMILAYIERGSMHEEWSFGQVVAVAVWLPTILGGLGDAMYGTLRGRANMLPGTLRIVRVDTDD